MAGVYCAECKVESEPGSLYCTSCGRPLRRFAGPRGVEWGPGEFYSSRPRRRRPWIVFGVGGAVVLLIGIAGVTFAVIGFRNLTRARPVALGETVDAGAWTVVVHKIVDPDNHVTDSALKGFSPTPAAGDRFIGARVTVTNHTGSVRSAVVGSFFDLRDRVGHTYTPTHFDGSFGFAGSTPLGGLDPGKSVAGTIVFEVPGTARSLTLEFLPDWPLRVRIITVAVP